MNNIYYVYVMFRPNGHPCYVGKGQGKRYRQHFRPKDILNHVNKHLASIIRLAGGELPVVITRSGLSNEDAIVTERAMISAIGRKTTGGPLVNLTDGGEGNSGWNPTPEIRENQRKARLKFYADNPEAVERIRKWATGRKDKPETTERRRAAKIGKTPVWMLNEATRMAVSKKIGDSNRGKRRKPMSEETKKKISLAKIGSKASDETRNKIRLGKLGRKHSAQSKANMGASRLGKKRGPYKKKNII